MAVKLVTDSTADIDRKTRKELDITIIPLTIHFPDQSFVDGEVPLDLFYSKLEQSPVIPTSSQPSAGDIQVVFEHLVSEGHDILAIFLSSGISGTYDSALKARERVLAQHPQANIEVIDSLNTVMALGYPVIEMAKEALAGKPFNQIVDSAKELLRRVHFYFIPHSLEHLRKGGRIGSAAALIGSILDLKPVLYYDDTGITAVARKVRSMRGAIEHMIGIMENDYKAQGLEAVIVQHINNPALADDVAEMIQTRFGIKPPIVPVGPIVGLHAGPGTIGIAYCLTKQPAR
ncbi:MAG TPA: DegV family protein [bacterium]|jgi:DegV family protein with EDD domain|nr:DegV family protein [bacterium]